MTGRLSELIADGRAHVFDGAMGTVLYGRGVFVNVCYDELNLTQPRLVLDVHDQYRAAGAEILETNTFGPIEIVQAFLPALRQSHAGRVINVSSGYGQLSDLSPNVPSYCLSKLALNGATIMLAAALAADGIAVNSMCPGWVRTDMGGASAPRSVEEGADTGVWLALDANQNLTGRFL